MSSTAADARLRAENYKRALRFLEGLTDFTYADYVKCIKMAGIEMTESELREQWYMAERTIPGTQSLRQIQMEVFVKGINIFGEISQKLGKSSKKWWQFWK